MAPISGVRERVSGKGSVAGVRFSLRCNKEMPPPTSMYSRKENISNYQCPTIHHATSPLSGPRTHARPSGHSLYLKRKYIHYNRAILPVRRGFPLNPVHFHYLGVSEA